MYINTYVLGVPEHKKSQYVAIAHKYAEVAKDFGALEIVENWECDVPDGEQTDYRKAIKAQPGERVVMSWVIWPDRETADKAHKGMFNDPRMTEIGEIPFDGKRMILGGFEPILLFRKAAS